MMQCKYPGYVVLLNGRATEWNPRYGLCVAEQRGRPVAIFASQGEGRRAITATRKLLPPEAVPKFTVRLTIMVDLPQKAKVKV